MIKQDVYGNIYYQDPLIPSRSISFNAQQFDKAKKVGPYKKPVVEQKATTTSKPKSSANPKFDLGNWFKSHYDQITSDPWAWAKNNPWEAAGGIGALTALLSGSTNNNNRGGFNLLNGLLPGLLVGGLTYGALKLIPEIRRIVKDHGNNVGEGMVNAGVNHLKELAKKVAKVPTEISKNTAEMGMYDVMQNTKKRVGTPITPVTPKIKDANGNTVPQGKDSQGNDLVRRETDVAKGWRPVKDAHGNINHYEEISKSPWDHLMDFKKNLWM